MTVQARRRQRRNKRPSAIAAKQPAFAFETTLGWIGIAHVDYLLTRIKFGYETETQLRAQFESPETSDFCSRAGKLDDFEHDLKNRFTQFAAGEAVDFDDLDIDQSGMTPFQRAVTDACRAIPYGETRSYAGLAIASGSPKAARAVGSVMSNNRYPLVVPCHRVVSRGGQIGGFSAPDGLNLKLRLLQLEGAIDFLDTV